MEEATETVVDKTPRMMSRMEAAYILMGMAASKKVSVKEVEAMPAAVRTLVKRHFNSKKNRARRREETNQETIHDLAIGADPLKKAFQRIEEVA